MNVNPGSLSKKIKIIENRVTKDDDGFTSYEKVTVHECWAQKTKTSGKELFEAGKDFVESKTRFLIRYTSKNIKEHMLIEYAGDSYDIEYVHNYEDSNEYIEIFCSLMVGAHNG